MILNVNVIAFILFLSGIVALSIYLSDANAQDTLLTDSDAIAYYSNPSSYVNNTVEFTGQISNFPPPNGNSVYSLQMYQGGELSRNTIVFYSNPIQLYKNECIRVFGTSQPIIEYQNMFGAKISAATINANSIEKIDCSETIEPALKIVSVNETKESNSVKMTLHKVEFSEKNTRVYLTIENTSPAEEITFYEFNSKAIQGKTQFTTTYSFGNDYPKIVSSIPPAIVETGVVLFEPLDPTQDEAQFRFEVKKGIDDVNFVFDVNLLLQNYNDILAKDPNDANSWVIKGVILHNLGNYIEALESYDKALAIEPNNSTVLYYKGLSISYLGNYIEAVEYFDKALAIDPDNAMVLMNKGETITALINSGNSMEAINYYEQILAKDPDNIDAMMNKGNILDEVGDSRESIKYYNGILATDPNNLFALVSKGNVLSELRNYTEAINYYNKALSIDLNYIHALIEKGDALYNLGNYSGAEENYEKVLAIDPNDTIAKARINTVLTKVSPQ